MISLIVTSAIWLIVAAGMQGALSERITIGWGKPDFLLVSAVILSIHRSTEGSAVTGFFAGLFHSALINDRLAALTISRMLACVISERLYAGFLGTGGVTAVIVSVIATFVAGLIYLFIGVPQNIWSYFADTIGSAIYNGAVAIPIYGIYRMFAKRRIRT
ncbi:MAG TPA: hypothetical protein VNK96_04855 [Fimbriimonadales bacterium]|nr:hypothetical protein [Fimbriimonadales bacterium]